jgi:hypothetical protein
VAVRVDARAFVERHVVEVRRRVRAARGAEDARDVEALAALLEEGPRRVPEVVVHHQAAAELQPPPVAVDALELAEAGDDIGLQVERAEARRADEAGRGRTHALDGLGAE